jgi:Ca2+-binding RTX toxin-like protein
VFYPGAAPESTTLPLYLTDLSGNDRQPVLLEIFQRQLLQPDEDIVGNNIVDLSDETEGKVIQTGDGHDTIIGSQGEDEIEAGRGDDFVDLGDSQSENGADEVIYRFDSSGQAVDGGDIIKNFHRGEDRFTFINVDSAAQTLQSFLRDAAGPDGIALTGDDLFTVSPALLRDEQGVVWVTGLLFRFKEGGTFDSGTRLAASQITLSFQSPMTTDGFFEAIGGITNFDAARLAVRDLTQITNLLGEQGLALETEGQTQLVVLEGTYAEGEPSLMVDLPEGQNTEVDTHVQLDVTETQSGRAPSVAWFTVYEDALRETISPHFGVVEDGNVFKLVLLAGNPLFLHEQGDMNNFDLFIVANDGVQDSALLQVHIQLKDVGLAPRDLTLDTLQVMEGRDGLVIGTLSAIDDDGDTDIQFSIATEGDYHLFEIVNGNQVKLVDDYQADYEMRNILEVSVTARDSVGLFVTEDFVVDVVNDASEAAAARYDDKGETYTYPGLELEDHIYQLFSGGGWAETLGQGLDLSFSFIDPDGSSLFVETYQQSGVQFDEHLVQMADVLKQSTRSTLELFEEVTLLNFVEVEEAETGTTGHLRFGLQNGKDTSQIVTFPGSRSSDTTHAWGDVWLNGTELGGLNQVPRFNNPPDLVDGSYFASTIMHETGHALGLYHPFQTSRITVTPYGDNQYRGSVDNIMSYTVMSYFNYVTEDTDTLPTFGLPTTLMINDIAALQYMYGVNEQTRRGDDLYTLASFNTKDQKFIHATIWDAAGEDTFSWADQTTKARISLVDGSHSFFGDIYNDGITDEDLNANLRDGSGVLGIAHGSDIENAIGGAASDLIVGNHLDNILFGGPLGGADTLIGGAGADVFVTSLATSNSAVTADKISDFSDGEDLIGLADITLDEVAWEDVTNGALDPRVRVYHSDSNFTLFYLDDVEIERVDASDFIQTDFV